MIFYCGCCCCCFVLHFEFFSRFFSTCVCVCVCGLYAGPGNVISSHCCCYCAQTWARLRFILSCTFLVNDRVDSDVLYLLFCCILFFIVLYASTKKWNCLFPLQCLCVHVHLDTVDTRHGDTTVNIRMPAIYIVFFFWLRQCVTPLFFNKKKKN